MRKFMILAAMLLLPMQASAQGGATSGSWILKPEGYYGYMGLIAVDDVGKSRGNHSSLSSYPAGTHFMIKYGFSIKGGAAWSNLDMPIDSNMCTRLIAEIEKNKKSVIAYNLSGGSKLKPVNKDFPAGVAASLLKKRELHYDQGYEIKTNSPVARSALCYQETTQAGQFKGKVQRLTALVAYTL